MFKFRMPGGEFFDALKKRINYYSARDLHVNEIIVKVRLSIHLHEPVALDETLLATDDETDLSYAMLFETFQHSETFWQLAAKLSPVLFEKMRTKMANFDAQHIDYDRLRLLLVPPEFWDRVAAIAPYTHAFVRGARFLLDQEISAYEQLAAIVNAPGDGAPMSDAQLSELLKVLIAHIDLSIIHTNISHQGLIRLVLKYELIDDPLRLQQLRRKLNFFEPREQKQCGSSATRLAAKRSSSGAGSQNGHVWRTPKRCKP